MTLTFDLSDLENLFSNARLHDEYCLFFLLSLLIIVYFFNFCILFDATIFGE